MVQSRGRDVPPPGASGGAAGAARQRPRDPRPVRAVSTGLTTRFPVTLADLIQQSTFASAEQESVLNVMATASWISGEIADALAPHGVTQAQYNVLRILRGQHPDCYTCSDIGSRLLDRTPDVTRLLVRLEQRGLLRRQRAEHDRRVVEVTITDEGLELLEALDAPVRATIERLGRHLSTDEHHTLAALLELMRTDQE